MSLRLCLGVVLIGVCALDLPGKAQQSSAPIVIPVPVGGAPVLGEGYSVLEGRLTGTRPCVTFTNTASEAPQTRYDVSRATNLVDAVEQGSFSVEAAVSSVLGSAGGGYATSYLRNRSMSEDLIKVAVHIDTRINRATSANLDSYTLERCGTHFVSAIVTGRSLTFESSIAKETARDLTSDSGNVHANGNGGSLGLQYSRFVDSLRQASVFTTSLKARGMKMPALSQKPDETMQNVVSYLNTVSTQIEGDPAAVLMVLSKYPGTSGPRRGLSDTISALLSAVARLVDLQMVERNSAFYVDARNMIPGGVTGVVEAEMLQVSDDIRRYQSELKSSSPSPTRVTPSPRVHRRISPAGWTASQISFSTNAAQKACAGDANSVVQVDIEGSWEAGNTKQEICDQTLMRCAWSGSVIDLTDPQQRDRHHVYLLGNQGTFSVQMTDYAVALGSTRGSVAVSCRPFFDTVTRERLFTETDQCVANRTAEGIRCKSRR